ncbi:hypothetical protein MNBD_CHLOROFLEXI01-5013 [hydrothermal vent metagenome]|uniref:Uncharacterized protein n=1 Tax=hydrothermal vent metagenome TaxID=652676 RepID=A0A3B0ULD2_9ZZZZ
MKKQVFKAKIKVVNQRLRRLDRFYLFNGSGPFPTSLHNLLIMVLIFFVAGCGETAVSTPTSILSTATTAVVTPTTALESTSVQTAVATPLSNRLSIGDPYAPELGNIGYDVSHYTLQMALDPAVTNIEATVQIEGVVTVSALTTLSLDFVGFDIGEVLLDGQPVPFVHENDKLILSPAEPLTENSPFVISVSYEGEPVERPSPYVGFAAFVGMSFVNGESIYVLSEPDGSRFWFPNNDHPRDKATYRFEITVPAGLTAVANGLLLDQIDTETDSTFIWEHDFPMASYLATVVVGEFVRIEDVSSDGVLLRHYASPEVQERFEETVDISGEAIGWMSERFGPYPFEAFGFVSADVQGVSLETQTMVLLASDMIGERTVIHELAHMWFGNWVSLDSWQEMWRNEGFATYVQLMWETGDDPENLQLVIESFRSAVEENGQDYPLGNPPPAQLFAFNTYFGGAVMVHELRQEMGDDAFFEGLQTYFATYGGGVASDAQFQTVMEEASGLSLDAFFAEWLE